MVNLTLEAAPILGGYNKRMGSTRLRERDDLAMVSVAIPLGDDASFASALSAGHGLAMPEPTRATISGQMTGLKIAPDQLMLIFPHSTPDAVDAVRSRLPIGYLTDQTDSWVVLEMTGPQCHAALERLSMVDLSDDAFPVGAFARTTMEHMGALVLRTKAGFLLMSASSSAASFAHALETSLKNVSAP